MTREYVWPELGIRPPEEYPNNFSAYFLWKSPDFIGSNMVADHDQMFMNNSSKFRDAVQQTLMGRAILISEFSKADADRFLSLYYNYPVNCVGMTRGCNVLTGGDVFSFYYRKG